MKGKLSGNGTRQELLTSRPPSFKPSHLGNLRPPAGLMALTPNAIITGFVDSFNIAICLSTDVSGRTDGSNSGNRIWEALQSYIKSYDDPFHSLKVWTLGSQYHFAAT